MNRHSFKVFGFAIVFTTALAAASLTAPLAAAPYKINAEEPKSSVSANVKLLQQISEGVSEISQQANHAVVFVAVSKSIKGMPLNELNPFDFFFGPGGQGGQGGQGAPGQPHHQQQGPDQKQKGLGSGFFIDLEKGYILTNNHVIEGADEIMLKLDNGKTYEGKVLGRDQNTDIALVQVKDAKFERKGLGELHLGDSDAARVGEFVLALGAPFGLESSTSLGCISAIGRGSLNITNLGNFLQTDAAINPGNSGGPLLNTRGLVIGINTAIYSRSGASAGIGFAIPSNLVRVIAEQLINKGVVARGYIGVRLVQELDDDLAAGLGLPEGSEGALISHVQAGTPAAAGGVESGDVVTAVNERKVRSNADLTNAIGLMAPGTAVELTLLRNNKPRKVTVTLGNFPDQDVLAKIEEQDQQEVGALPAGLSLQPIDPSAKNYAALKSRHNFTSKRGLLVVQVAQNSKGEAAGIRPGDVLLNVNKKEVRTIDDFKRLYKETKKLLIQLEREGTFLFAAVRK